MENTMLHNNLQVLCEKIAQALSMERLGNKIYRMFESLPEDSVINYIGELNRNDVMH